MNIFELLIIQPIFNVLMLIYSIVPGGDIGLTIILFTILVRVLMYPLIKKQLHQTKMMRKLQPKLAKIKKDAKGNRQLEAAQMMELYKKHGVSPFRSIGILLVQLPIFIGLFYAIRILTVDRGQIATYMYNPLESIGPIKQLIENPDSINHMMLGFIDLSKHAMSNTGVDIALLVLALLSAVTQYIMSKQTLPTVTKKRTFKQIMNDAAEGKQPDQSEMNAMMAQNMAKFMPVMMFFIMINLPGALALYYTASNLVAVAQQAYLLRGDEEEMEEIADEAIAAEKTKKRVKEAKEANITRITAKDSGKRKVRR